MPYTFSFNGITKDYVYMLRGRKRSAWAPRSLNLLTVPRKPGAYLQGVETSVREIEVPIGLVAESIGDLQKMKEDLAAWLVTDEPKELIFEDEPDRIYYAIVDETLDLEEIVRIGQGTIRFVCPDPYKYGFEKEASFPSDVVSLNYEGTAPGDPVFELEVVEPVTFAMIQNQDEEYMMIGRPAEVTTPIVNTKTLLLYENGETIGSWTPATPEMEGGSQGTIGYDGAGITAPNYGTGTGYHGPSVFKEVPPTQDFEIELRGQLYTDHVNQTGRFGFFLFDEQMRQIAFMAAIDNSQYVNRKLAEGRIGPYIGDFKNYIISSRNYQKDWDNFPAYLRLRRIGDRYEFYVARVLGNGAHFEPLTASWTVFEDQFRGRLRYVGIFIDKYGDTASPHTNRIDYIRVHALTQAAEDQTPYIAYPGDVITFDHKNSDILLNGESRMDLKQFGASFFKLKPGQNQFVVMPDSSFNVKVRFKERFL
ncbi:distal tail protein [Geobacillus phage vB_GthS_PT9.1]|nr:distal tail protein [Geobacillus phage vB_GthS_PT9.1]